MASQQRSRYQEACRIAKALVKDLGDRYEIRLRSFAAESSPTGIEALEAKTARRNGDRPGRGHRFGLGQRTTSGAGPAAAERRRPQCRRHDPAPRDDGPGQVAGHADLHAYDRRAGRGPRLGSRDPAAPGVGLRPPAGARGRHAAAAGIAGRPGHVAIAAGGKRNRQANRPASSPTARPSRSST